jgi:hypothetical protein
MSLNGTIDRILNSGAYFWAGLYDDGMYDDCKKHGDHQLQGWNNLDILLIGESLYDEAVEHEA